MPVGPRDPVHQGGTVVSGAHRAARESRRSGRGLLAGLPGLLARGLLGLAGARLDDAVGAATAQRGGPKSSERRPLEPDRERTAPPATRHFMIGMPNSAPARMPVGQRAVTVLSRV